MKFIIRLKKNNQYSKKSEVVNTKITNNNKRGKSIMNKTYDHIIQSDASSMAIEHINNILMNYNNITEKIGVLKSFNGKEKELNSYEQLNYFKNAYNTIDKVKWDLYKIFGNELLSQSKPLRKIQLKEALFNAFSYIEETDKYFKYIKNLNVYKPFFKYLKSINFNSESFFSKLRQDFYRCSHEFDIVERYIYKWNHILKTGVLFEKDFYSELHKENFIYTYPHVRMKIGKINFKSDALFFSQKGIFALNVKKFDDKEPFLINIEEDGTCIKASKNKEEDITYLNQFTEESSINYSNLVNSILNYANKKSTKYKVQSVVALSNNNIVIKNKSNAPIIKLEELSNYILSKPDENSINKNDLAILMNFFVKYNKNQKTYVYDYIPCVIDNLKYLIKVGTITINIINALKYYENETHINDTIAKKII